MTMKIVEGIRDKSVHRRDLLVDKLSDQFEHGYLSEEEKKTIVLELVQFLKRENDDAVIESIFNLLSTAFSDNVCINLIAQVAASTLQRLKPGSLIHALLILGESALPDKKALIEQYLSSENVAVREAAQEALL